MPKGVILAIGLNRVDPIHYYGAAPLTGCVADAEAVSAIAREAGFAVADTLLNEVATREKLIGTLGELAKDLAPGDILLLHYSGHGAQVPDECGDERDRLDETWCLYDSMLIDDELVPLWARFKPGVRIVVFSDSCHSGTVSRELKVKATTEAHHRARKVRSAVEPDGPIAIRGLPDDAAAETYHAHRDRYREIKASAPKSPDVGAAVLLISGCRDDQTSKDIGSHGAFTKALIETWDGGTFAGSYRDLRKQIRGLILERYDQDPQLSTMGRGVLELPNERPFSIGV